MTSEVRLRKYLADMGCLTLALEEGDTMLGRVAVRLDRLVADRSISGMQSVSSIASAHIGDMGFSWAFRDVCTHSATLY
jgi:hypothetical protein